MARRTQIVIRDMGANFSPGNIVCIIPDPRNLGVALYANDTGGVYFTLPVDHPALPLIQPLKQHYQVQRLDGTSYVTIAGGIVTDYDAANNEVVINGADYMTALDKYYTPINGPQVGDKAIPSSDTTSLGGGRTPKSLISDAVDKDRDRSENSYSVAVADSTEPKLGHIEIFESTAAGAPVDTLFSEYETDSGNKTGVISLSGKIVIYKNSNTVKWIDGELGKELNGNFTISDAGVLFYAEPGGPLYNYTRSDIDNTGTADTSFSFDIKFRPVSKFNSSNENNGPTTGTTRMASILTEGVSYEFYAIPWYTATVTPTTGSSYTQTFWGKQTGRLKVQYTSGLVTDTLSNAFSNAISNASSPLYVLDRKNDYPSSSSLCPNISIETDNSISYTVYRCTDNITIYAGDTFTVTGASSGLNGNKTALRVTRAYLSDTSLTEIWVARSTNDTISNDPDCRVSKSNTVLNPIVKFTTLEQVNTPTIQPKHPYITAGQGPVDFLRQLSEIEMGTRTDKSKVVFNYYGVPGATVTGTKLIVNHRVSSTPQALLMYPGNIKDFNVVSKRSSKVNSVRVIASTPFLLGASTEGASGAKSKGVVRVGKYNDGDPALPVVVAQDGFISSESAANYGLGILNDFNLDSDVTMIQVSLRSEAFGPIGVSGTPKLGESVKVVINRKSSNVQSDRIEDIYNIGGMEWFMDVDGHERLYLDLVKPSKFKGPAITWGTLGTSPETGDIDMSDTAVEEKKKKKKKKKKRVFDFENNPYLNAVRGPEGWNVGMVKIVGLPSPVTNALDPRLLGVAGDSMAERMATFNRMRLSAIAAQLAALQAQQAGAWASSGGFGGWGSRGGGGGGGGGSWSRGGSFGGWGSRYPTTVGLPKGSGGAGGTSRGGPIST